MQQVEEWTGILGQVMLNIQYRMPQNLYEPTSTVCYGSQVTASPSTKNRAPVKRFQDAISKTSINYEGKTIQLCHNLVIPAQQDGTSKSNELEKKVRLSGRLGAWPKQRQEEWEEEEPKQQQEEKDEEEEGLKRSRNLTASPTAFHTISPPEPQTMPSRVKQTRYSFVSSIPKTGNISTRAAQTPYPANGTLIPNQPRVIGVQIVSGTYKLISFQRHDNKMPLLFGSRNWTMKHGYWEQKDFILPDRFVLYDSGSASSKSGIRFLMVEITIKGAYDGPAA